jgi:hypothetical protein
LVGLRRTRRKSEEVETAEATAGPEVPAPENSEDPVAVSEVPAAELDAAVAMAAASDAPVSELDAGPSGDEVTENKAPPVDEPVTSTSEAEQPAEAKQTRRGWWRR